MAHALKYQGLEEFKTEEEAKQYAENMRKLFYCVFMDKDEDEYYVLIYQRLHHSYSVYEKADYLEKIHETDHIAFDNLADAFGKLSELFREYPNEEDYIAYLIYYNKHFCDYILEWEIFRRKETDDIDDRISESISTTIIQF